jgi:hypothetical protein
MRKPSQIANHLAGVVAKINNSKKPDRSLVASELRRVAAELDPLTPSQICSQALLHGLMVEPPEDLATQIAKVKQYCATNGIDPALCQAAVEYLTQAYGDEASAFTFAR